MKIKPYTHIILGRKVNRYTWLLLTVVLIVIISFAGCRQKTTQRPEQPAQPNRPDTLRIIYANWAEGVAISHLAARLIEQHYPYRVQLESYDISTVYNRLAFGRADLFLDAWLPRTHQFYWSDYDSLLVDLGVNVPNVRTGLVVPAYVSITSIEQLDNLRRAVNGNIIGIERSAGIMASTEQVMSAYKLPMELLVTSDPEMVQALSDAIKQQDPIVVTGWQPHWKFIAYDLKFLDDPKGVFPTEESIHSIGRYAFEQDYPELTEFLQRFQLTAEKLSSLMYKIHQDEASRAKIIDQWLDEHPELVSGWLPATTDTTQSAAVD